MIRAHVAAPASGGLHELQRENGGTGPETPGTPKTTNDSVSTGPLPSGASASTQDHHAEASGAGKSRGTLQHAEAIAPPRYAPAEPTVTELLALARSSGDASPLAAHRMLEAVSEGSLRQVQNSAATVTLDPMCCVGCGTLMHDLSSLGLRRAPLAWEWRCQGCLQPARRLEQPTHTICTPEQ